MLPVNYLILFSFLRFICFYIYLSIRFLLYFFLNLDHFASVPSTCQQRIISDRQICFFFYFCVCFLFCYSKTLNAEFLRVQRYIYILVYVYIDIGIYISIYI